MTIWCLYTDQLEKYLFCSPQEDPQGVYVLQLLTDVTFAMLQFVKVFWRRWNSCTGFSCALSCLSMTKKVMGSIIV